MRRQILAGFASMVVVTLSLVTLPARATCPLSIGLPNVGWALGDSVAGCPGGDSLRFAHSPSHPHPMWVRITVHYEDADCNAKGNVPAESIWVTHSTVSGNLIINDASQIIADDRTSVAGNTRITIPSFSGSGKARFTLFVSGVNQGSKTVAIRTVDTNADRTVTSADAVGTADLNYNGVAGDTTDVRLVNNHIGHKSQLFWAAPEFVSACPAGDSVVAGRSSRLRVQVWYRNSVFFPKYRVPQDSFVVTTSVVSGNVRVNDEAAQTFAGDSTNLRGIARITLPSLSGCGTLRIALTVSGLSQGTRDVVVTTTDSDADINGKVTTSDQNAACDLDGSGSVTQADRDLVAQHLGHWKRNTLHGELVRRTNLCETCQYGANNTPPTIGASEISWSPDGKYIALSVFMPPYGNCEIHYVPSSPPDDALTQVTAPTQGEHDYDPSWSPTNTEIAFDRDDSEIHAAQLVALPDSSRLILNDGISTIGPAISPNGKWIAFSRRHPLASFEIWKIAIEGTPSGAAPIQLTTYSLTDDHYPQWSPDGRYIIFERRSIQTEQRFACRVPAAGGPVDTILKTTAMKHTVTPAYSPDGRIVVAGNGDTVSTALVTTRTLDATLINQTDLAKAIPAYPTHGVTGYGDLIYGVLFPIPTPRLSPDGTRLAMRAASPVNTLNHPQIWAARRSMSLPPQIVSVNTTSIPSDQAILYFTILAAHSYTYTITSFDPEGDAIGDTALYQESWMSWNAAQHKLTVNPEVISGTYHVLIQVTTPSGGTDRLILAFTVCPQGGCLFGANSQSATEEEAAAVTAVTLGPNPAVQGFWLSTAKRPGITARLQVFDLSGRIVGDVTAPSGNRLTWCGNESGRVPAAPGVYLYRLQAGSLVRQGRFVLLR